MKCVCLLCCRSNWRNMLTTLKRMAHVDRPLLRYLHRRSLSSSKQLPAARDLTGFNGIQTKPKSLWCTTGRHQYQLPAFPLLIDSCCVSSVLPARYLGIYNIDYTTCRCMRYKRYRTSHPSLDTSGHVQTTVVDVVQSQLDYSNAILDGLSTYLHCPVGV